MKPVLFEKDGGVLRISLNRVSSLNAINSGLLEELEQGLKAYTGDRDIEALALFGQGGCFAAGADIKELSTLDEEGIRRFHGLRERTFSLLEGFPAPTVAMIERYALGTGLELALCCDFRIAGEDARLGVPSAGLGLVESYEYMTRLVGAIGPFWAKKLIFTGERIDAATALRIGLIEETAPSAEVSSRTDSLLHRILENSANAMRESKRVIEACTRDPNLFYVPDRALPLVASMRTPDFKEAVQAFLEKRKAKSG